MLSSISPKIRENERDCCDIDDCAHHIEGTYFTLHKNSEQSAIFMSSYMHCVYAGFWIEWFQLLQIQYKAVVVHFSIKGIIAGIGTITSHYLVAQF